MTENDNPEFTKWRPDKRTTTPWGVVVVSDSAHSREAARANGEIAMSHAERDTIALVAEIMDARVVEVRR